MATRGSYPHPVLDTSDDVASRFEITGATVEATQEDVEIKLQVVIDDPDLLGYINSGLARYSLRWTCGATISTGEIEPEILRKHADGVSQRIFIDQQNLKGEVDVELHVIADKPISSFKWSRQNAEYGNAVFDIDKGDIVAFGGSFTFNANKQYDPLSPPVGSCFKFIQDPKLRKGIRVHFDSKEEVIVRIPSSLMERLHHFSGWPDLQIATLVLPALMETLAFMKANRESEEEDLSDFRWVVAITNMVDKNGGFEEGLLHLAQKILENPIDRALLTGIEMITEGD